MRYQRMPIEIESPEEMGYGNIRYNLAESSVRDISLSQLDVDLKNLVLFYGEHKGMVKLREAILAPLHPQKGGTEKHKATLSVDDVLVTTGAATALFIVATAILNPEDHLVVIRPNYGTNLETPRAINCQLSIVDLKFEDGFELDVKSIRDAMRPNTKLISITNPHNPSGKLFDERTISEIISLAEEHGCYLLMDETYRDLNFQTALKPYAAELSQKAISVSSVSKSFGAPGIRIGWIVCRDQKLMHDLLAAKEQISLCNSVVDEEIALYLLQHKEQLIEQHHSHIRKNFEYMKQWFAQQPFLEWVEPNAGVVCFPRLKASQGLDIEKFYQALFQDYSTIVGPGHWFERDKVYMRIGFGYPTFDELKQGLQNLDKCLKTFVK